MEINIITSPFGFIPPNGIGAIEKRWYDTAQILMRMGHCVHMYAKAPDNLVVNNEVGIKVKYIPGFGRTSSIYRDIFLDMVYSYRALRCMAKCDILVMNTFASPILAPLLFRGKYKKSVFNVDRFPKKHLALYSKIDCFSCVSQATYNALINLFPQYSLKSTVVSNPIRTDIFDVNRTTHQRCCRQPLISYHGRIHPEKGLEILVTACNILHSKFKNLSIELIGPVDIAKGGGGDDYKQKLIDLSKCPITFVQPIADRAELAEHLSRCTAYCYPSIAEKGETFGVSPLEAMGLGLPVVVSALDCFKDFVIDGDNALVFDHRASDAVELCAAKLELILKDANYAEELGTSAYMTSRKFSVDNIALRYEALFQSLLENK